jgi:hypothetical protein
MINQFALYAVQCYNFEILKSIKNETHLGHYRQNRTLKWNRLCFKDCETKEVNSI